MARKVGDRPVGCIKLVGKSGNIHLPSLLKWLSEPLKLFRCLLLLVVLMLFVVVFLFVLVFVGCTPGDHQISLPIHARCYTAALCC